MRIFICLQVLSPFEKGVRFTDTCTSSHACQCCFLDHGATSPRVTLAVVPVAAREIGRCGCEKFCARHSDERR